MSDISDKVVKYLDENGKSKNDDYKDFDQLNLALGTLVELEHGDDVRVSEEITKDHLKENPKEYTDSDRDYLAEIEDEYIKPHTKD